MFSEDSIRNMKDSIESGRPASGPTDLQILPTARCNAACAFCPLQAVPSRHKPRVPRFTMYKEDLPGGVLDRLADDLYHLGGLKRVTITGGEPLLYGLIIPAIFQFTRSFPEARLTIVTNGLRLKKFAPILPRLGLHNLSVSLNAGRPESYASQNPGSAPESFGQILEGIESLVKTRNGLELKDPHVTLSVVLTRHSAGDVKELYEIGARTGVNAVTFIPLMRIVIDGDPSNDGLALGREDLARFHEELAMYSEKAKNDGFYLGYAGEEDDGGVISDNGLYKTQPCYAGYSFAAVYPSGDVRTCCHCEPIMGNLRHRSFGEIWNSEKYAGRRRKMAQIHNNGGIIEGCLCSECGYLFENKEYHRLLGTAGNDERP